MRKHSVKLCLLLSTALSVGTVFVEAARADDQAADQNSAAEIVVTARRIEERLQDVPASVSVFSGRQLEDHGISTAADLAAYTPSLSVGTQFGTDFSTFVVRGFSQDIGTSPTVGTYFADVVAPRGGFGGTTIHAGEGAGPGSLFDLQNVQVLKGPQGTLFGRNTTGGAVLLVPKKPTPDFEGYVEVGYGNYDALHTQAVVNVPITDKVRVRVGYDEQKRQGYLQNISGIGPSNLGDINYQAGRISIVANITDDIEDYIVASYVDSDNSGLDSSMTACNPGFAFLGPLACAQLAKDAPKAGPYTVDSPLYPERSFLRQWQVINTTTWNANDDLTVKNIMSYAALKTVDDSGLFGDDLPFFGGTHIELTSEGNPQGLPLTDQDTFTEELQLHGYGLSHKLDWQAGLYMEGSFPIGLTGSSGVNTNDCANFQTFNCVPVLGPASSVGVREGTTNWRDYAVYSEGTYTFDEQWKLTAGLRFTKDEQNAFTQRYDVYFAGPDKPILPITRTCEAGMTPINPVTGQPIIFPDVNPANCSVTDHTHSSAPTGRINLQYTPMENLLLYAQYGRGYRAGGILSTGPFGNTTFNPENVNAYELGEKWSFDYGDVKGIVDAAAFYNDLQNAQIQGTFVSTTVAGAAPNAGILNGGAARVWGLETDTSITAFKDWTATFGYTYLNSKLLKAPSAPADSIYNIFGPGTPVGGTLPLTPHSKFSTTLTYRLPLDASIGKVSASTTVTYTGSQFVFKSTPYDVAQPWSNIPTTTLVDLNVNWEGIYGSALDAEFFMNNVFDRHYELYTNNDVNVFGWAAVEWGPPRMFGGRLRYHF